jgi:hypothetical protein
MNLKNLRTKLMQSGRIVLEYLVVLLSLVLSLVALSASLLIVLLAFILDGLHSITSEQFATMLKTPSPSFLSRLVSLLNRIRGTLLRLSSRFPQKSPDSKSGTK